MRQLQSAVRARPSADERCAARVRCTQAAEHRGAHPPHSCRTAARNPCRALCGDALAGCRAGRRACARPTKHATSPVYAHCREPTGRWAAGGRRARRGCGDEGVAPPAFLMKSRRVQEGLRSFERFLSRAHGNCSGNGGPNSAASASVRAFASAARSALRKGAHHPHTQHALVLPRCCCCPSTASAAATPQMCVSSAARTIALQHGSAAQRQRTTHTHDMMYAPPGPRQRSVMGAPYSSACSILACAASALV
jgi:hypothetical protein